MLQILLCTTKNMRSYFICILLIPIKKFINQKKNVPIRTKSYPNSKLLVPNYIVGDSKQLTIMSAVSHISHT